MFIVASLTTVAYFFCSDISPLEFIQTRIPPILVKPNRPKKDWEKEMVEGVKGFESFYSNPYYCPAGVLTVGYGHTGKYANQKMSRDKAHSILMDELNKAKRTVQRYVHVPLKDHQLYALTSFTYNCGEKNLIALVNGKNRLNSGNYDSVNRLLPSYRKGGNKVLRGLVKRRKWEVELWKGEFVLPEMQMANN